MAGVLPVALVFSIHDALSTVSWAARGGGDAAAGDPVPLNMTRVGVWCVTVLIGGWIAAVAATRRAPLWSAEALVAACTAAVDCVGVGVWLLPYDTGRVPPPRGVGLLPSVLALTPPPHLMHCIGYSVHQVGHVAQQQFSPQWKALTFLCTNRRGFLVTFRDEEPETVSSWIAGEVGHIAQCVAQHK
eukprot:gene40045-27098_t